MPQFPRLRPLIGRIHRWLGIALGLYLAFMGLTGSLLVFADEIHTPAANTSKPNYDVLVAEEKVRRIKVLDDAAWTVRTKEGETYVDPSTGKKLGTPTEGFLPLMKDLHTNLAFGDRGRAWTAWLGLGAVWLLLTGVIAWWPRTRAAWRHRLRVERKRGSKRLTFDLHAVVGAYVAIPLLIIAFTGMLVGFGEPVQKWVDATFGPGSKSKSPKVSVVGEPRPVSELVESAQSALPGFNTRYVHLPKDTDAPLRVEFIRPGEDGLRRRHEVAVHPGTGEVLQVDEPQPWETVKAIHFATWGGVTTMILAVFLGLFPVLLAVTGFLMWLRRWRETQARKQKKSTTRGA